MSQAPVGFHCPECLRSGRQKVITTRSLIVRPLLTQVLVAINVAVFIAELAIPRLGLEGVLFGPLVAAGEWWRLVTGGFLHAGIFHIGFNMAALWILGSQFESALGRLRYAIVYGGSLLGGSLGVMLLSPFDSTVGASGAIFGLMGLALAAHVRRGISVWDTGIGGLLAINLFITFFLPGISIGGHLGGLGAGFLIGLLVVDAPRGSDRAWIAVAGGLAVTVALFVGALLIAVVRAG